jgi:hypothetical protein
MAETGMFIQSGWFVDFLAHIHTNTSINGKKACMDENPSTDF